MKKKSDPRHLLRRETVQALFEWGFRNDVTESTDRVNSLLSHVADIDRVIEKTAPQWPLAQINRTDLSILRLAIYELYFETETPAKVVIDEAVELGKEFGTDSSGPFINGVLGNVMTHYDEYKQDLLPQQNAEQPNAVGV